MAARGDENEQEEEYWRGAHESACAAGAETYVDTVTGLTVFTRLAHENRGKCCGCGCRHCPFKARRSGAKETAAESGASATTTVSTANPAAAGGAPAGTPAGAPAGTLAATADPHEKRRNAKNCVYTKTGDAGTSSLFTGERVSKDDVVFEALGTIDELVSFCGAAHAACLLGGGNGLHEHLEQVIKVLMTIASHVATPASSAKASRRQLARTRFGPTVARPHIAALEAWIDDATEALPDLRSFVLPLSGTAAPACAALHVCRSVCRRCERRVLSVGSDVDPAARKYLNRLSDFLFVAARYAGDQARRREGAGAGEEACYRADEVARDAKTGLRLKRLCRDDDDDATAMSEEMTTAAEGETKPGVLPRRSPPSSFSSSTLLPALAAVVVAVLIGMHFLSSLPTAGAVDADAADKFDVNALLDGDDGLDMEGLMESLSELGVELGQRSGSFGVDEASEALRVFQQVQEEMAREKIDLSGVNDGSVWGALSSIRKQENSMRFLRSMRDQAASLASPYSASNYGYGMVFFAGFRKLWEELFAVTAAAAIPPRRVLVLGSNLGTEALFFLHLFGRRDGGDDVTSRRRGGVHVTGVEILCDLVKFARENLREHGFHESSPHRGEDNDDDRIDFVCGDALDVAPAMLADADIVWIDNQVWDLPLAVDVAEMLQSARMKSGALVVDFASASRRGVLAAYVGEAGGTKKFEEVGQSSSSDDAGRSQGLFRLATSWAGSRPGAPVRAFVRR